ncbi:MAG: hypothetical protein ACKPCM_04305 [Pseudanabaena sp.]
MVWQSRAIKGIIILSDPVRVLPTVRLATGKLWSLLLMGTVNQSQGWQSR